MPSIDDLPPPSMARSNSIDDLPPPGAAPQGGTPLDNAQITGISAGAPKNWFERAVDTVIPGASDSVNRGYQKIMDADKARAIANAGADAEKGGESHYKFEQTLNDLPMAVAGNIGGGMDVVGGRAAVASPIAKKIANLPDSLKSAADDWALRAGGFKLKDLRQLFEKGRLGQMGRYMIDNGLVSAGSSVEDIAKAAEKLNAQHGENIGDILKRLDDSGALAPSHEQMASQVESQAKPLADMSTARPTYKTLQNVAGDIRTMGKPKPPAAGTIEQLTGRGEEYLLGKDGNPIAKFQDGKMVTETGSGSAGNLDATIPSNPNLGANVPGTFRDAQDVKEFIDRQIKATGGWKQPNPSEKNLALRDAYRSINSMIEDSAGQGAEAVGDKDLLQKYKSEKSGYQNSEGLAKAANDQVLRNKANSILSLTDKITGTAGAVAGFSSGDSLEDRLKHAALGATAALGAKGIRTYGPAITSRLLDATSRGLSKVRAPLGAVAGAADRTALAGAGGIGSIVNPIESAAMRSVAGEQDGGSDQITQDMGNHPMPAGGEDRWAAVGAQKMGLAPEMAVRLLRDPTAKSLLVKASDLQPGSPAFNKIMQQLKSMGGKR